jgi:hypothetical protein
MMRTEQQARKLWCPMVRYTEIFPNGSSVTGNRWWSHDQDNHHYVGTRCIASECMMWRCDWADPDRGFCGLAGVVEPSKQELEAKETAYKERMKELMARREAMSKQEKD